MNFSDATKNEVSIYFNKSRYFSPNGKKVIDPSFVDTIFWVHFFDLDRNDALERLFESLGEKTFNEKDCVEHILTKNASSGKNRYAMARRSVALPQTLNFEARSYRVSPRTAHFFLEFGCLRQVKPACNNRACINPYHQVTESDVENNDREIVKASPNVRKFSVPNFVFGMSVSQALNIAYEAGNTPHEILNMPMQEFVNVAMAHYNYAHQINRKVTEHSVTLSISDLE